MEAEISLTCSLKASLFLVYDNNNKFMTFNYFMQRRVVRLSH